MECLGRFQLDQIAAGRSVSKPARRHVEPLIRVMDARVDLVPERGEHDFAYVGLDPEGQSGDIFELCGNLSRSSEDLVILRAEVTEQPEGRGRLLVAARQE